MRSDWKHAYWIKGTVLAIPRDVRAVRRLHCQWVPTGRAVTTGRAGSPSVAGASLVETLPAADNATLARCDRKKQPKPTRATHVRLSPGWCRRGGIGI